MVKINVKLSLITVISLIFFVSCGKQNLNHNKDITEKTEYTENIDHNNVPNTALADEKKGLDIIKTSLQALPAESIKSTGTNIYLENQETFKNEEIYALNNRYFIPFEKLLGFLKADFSVQNNNIIITYKNKKITLDTKNPDFSVDGAAQKLTRPIFLINNDIYINLFDISNLFNLQTKWDFGNKKIFLYENAEIPAKKASQIANAKPALIRLEDIAPDPRQSPEELEKLRIIGDFLYSKGVIFHVAWIPRFINPALNIDNEPATAYSMYNADFVFTLDYLMKRNGLIGLHGYTHQYGNSVSVDGIEFHTTYKNDKIPGTDEYAEDRITKAINSAKKLDIPYTFFEAPHYAATPKQFKVMERFFDILYEPYSPDGLREINTKVYTVKNGNKTTSYIPTPLDCLNGKKDFNGMLNRINNLKEGNLASFFYHPYLEYEFINFTETQNGCPKYSYSEDSFLHKIIETLRAQGYEFKSVNELVK